MKLPIIIDYPFIGSVQADSYKEFEVVTKRKLGNPIRKRYMRNKTTLRPPIYFDIPDSDKEKYIKALIEFSRKKGEENPEEQAEKYFQNLKLGLSVTGKKTWRIGSEFFDKRISVATRGIFVYGDDWNKYRGKYTQRILESPYVEHDKSNLKDLKSSEELPNIETQEEKNEYDKELEALLKEYPTLDRPDIRNDVELYVKINVRLKNLAKQDFKGSEMAIRNLMDAKLKLGEFLGLSEEKRKEEDLLIQKDNIASLSKQFEITLSDFPEYQEKLRRKEIKMVLNKFKRQEISRWLAESDSHLGCTIEEAQKIIGE